MKKKASNSAPPDMRPEYKFDYRKVRPKRFAGRRHEGVVAVVLDPDVASVFHSADSVNGLLRSIIAALPAQRQKRVRRKKGSD